MAKAHKKREPTDEEYISVLNFNYSTSLRAKIDAPGLSKGERTHLRLSLSTLECLNEKGYDELQVSDICERAGLSHGLFYHYFSGKPDAVTQVIKGYLTDFEASSDSLGKTDDAWWDILFSIYSQMKILAAHPAISRIFHSDYEAIEDIRSHYVATTSKWQKRLAKRMPASVAGRSLSEMDRLVLSVILGCHTDHISFLRTIVKHEHLRRKNHGLSNLAELMAVMWFRTIYLEDPSPEQVNSAQHRLNGLLLAAASQAPKMETA